MPIAELNIGKARHPLESDGMADFMNNLDRINALAERSPGFIWRMQSDGGNATDIDVPGAPELISNLTVWDSVESLGSYVFNTVHAQFYNRATEFFIPQAEAHFVMWPVADGHLPTMEEAMARLAQLREHGSGPEAFGWDFVDTSAWRRCEAAE